MHSRCVGLVQLPRLPPSRPSYLLSSPPLWPVGKVFSVQALGRFLLACGSPCFSGNHCPLRSPCEPCSCEHKTCLTSFLSFLVLGIGLSHSCEYYYSKLCVHSVQPHLPGFPLYTHTHTHIFTRKPTSLFTALHTVLSVGERT